MKLKHISGIALFAIIGLISCNEDQIAQDKKATIRNHTDATLPQNCYKRLEGTIAGQPVVLQLQKAGVRFEAMYYYKKEGRWITLNYVADSSSKERLYFYEYTEGNLDMNGSETQNAKITGNYSNGAFNGQWISGDNTKKYDFKLEEGYPAGSYRFTVLSFADSAIAFASKPDGPMGKISEMFVLPEGGDETATWLRTQIKKILYLDSSGSGLAIEDAVKKSNAAYLASYKNDTKGMENEEFMATLNYESMQQVTVRYNERGYVVLESLAYDYSGGAHGNHGSALYCLDVANKQHLALQDIITADSNQLKVLLEKNFRSQAHLAASQPLTEYLFENRLMPNDNFYFTEKGIGFLYNPYEVAAYAIGQINVFIPYTELKQYLQPDFAKRMGL